MSHSLVSISTSSGVLTRYERGATHKRRTHIVQLAEGLAGVTPEDIENYRVDPDPEYACPTPPEPAPNEPMVA